MRNEIAVHTASFVARETGYAMHGWGHGDRMTNEAFAPIDTFAERFDSLLGHIQELGFDAIDIWGAHLSPAWATEEHVHAARDALARRGMRVATYAPWIDAANVRRACEVAVALDAPLDRRRLRGRRRADRAGVSRARCPSRGREPSRANAGRVAREDRARRGAFGATVDTGWWATQGYDAAQAIEELGAHVLHVHLKDVLAEGEPHETCRFGEGIVDVRECVRALERIGYEGAISIEHEPETFDPSDDLRAMRARARGVARVKVALVGAGVIAQSYAARIAEVRGLELTGATDVLPAARRRSSRSTAAGEYPSLDALLADDAVDVVVNLTPASSHVAVTTRRARGRQARAHREAGRAHGRDARELGGSRRTRRPPQLRAGDAARRGAADRVEGRARRSARHGSRRVCRGELGPHRALASVARVAVRGRPARRRRDLSADDPDRDVRPCSPRHRVRDDAAARTCAQGRHERSRCRRRIFYFAALDLADGVAVRLTASYWVGPDRQRGIEFHGDDASLWMPTWGESDSRLLLTTNGEDETPVPPLREPYPRHRLGGPAARSRRRRRAGQAAPDERRARGARPRRLRGDRGVGGRSRNLSKSRRTSRVRTRSTGRL